MLANYIFSGQSHSTICITKSVFQTFLHYHSITNDENNDIKLKLAFDFFLLNQCSVFAGKLRFSNPKSTHIGYCAGPGGSLKLLRIGIVQFALINDEEKI